MLFSYIHFIAMSYIHWYLVFSFSSMKFCYLFFAISSLACVLFRSILLIFQVFGVLAVLFLLLFPSLISLWLENTNYIIANHWHLLMHQLWFRCVPFWTFFMNALILCTFCCCIFLKCWLDLIGWWCLVHPF